MKHQPETIRRLLTELEVRPSALPSRDAQRSHSVSRGDRQQPIIIQNFEMHKPSQSRARKNPHLSAANLYLSPVALSRQTPPTTPLQPIGSLLAHEVSTAQSNGRNAIPNGQSNFIKDGQYWKPSIDMKQLSKKKRTFSEECSALKPLKTTMGLKYVVKDTDEYIAETPPRENKAGDTEIMNGNPENNHFEAREYFDENNIDFIAEVNDTPDFPVPATARNSVCSSALSHNTPNNSEALDLNNLTHLNHIIAEHPEDELDLANTVPDQDLKKDNPEGRSSTVQGVPNMSGFGSRAKPAVMQKRVSFKLEKDVDVQAGFPNYEQDSWYARERSDLVNGSSGGIRPDSVNSDYGRSGSSFPRNKRVAQSISPDRLV